MIREEIQCLIDDSHDSSKYQKYSECGWSWRHRETGLIVIGLPEHGELGESKFGRVRERIELNDDEANAMVAIVDRLRAFATARQNKRGQSLLGKLFSRRLADNYRLVSKKAEEA